MPGPRAYFASCAAGGKFYAFGGDDGAHIDTVVAYDPATDSWSSKAPMPVQRTSAEAVEAGGKIYVLGGFINGTALTTRVDVYDPATDSWGVPVAPMPTLRTTFGVASIDGIIYAVGGSDGGELSTVEAYDPVSNTWETKAPMQTARAYVGVGVINGLLYAVGSSNGSVAFEAYDPATDTWSTKPSLPTTRFIPGTGVLGGRLYVIGGATSVTLNVVEVYDPEANSWGTGPAMPTDRYGFGVGVSGGVLYAFGGATFTGGFNVLPTVEALSLEEEAGPRERTLDLLNVVRGFTLQRGISNSFESKLQKVVTALDSPAGAADACDQLNAFINHARAQSGKHLTAAQASQLIAEATQISSSLGCQ
jgi:N-acetylneuraminic acid mutarotase